MLKNSKCYGTLYMPVRIKQKTLHAHRQPPIPLKGGFRRPSNITRDYAQLKSKLSASPHNQRYVKWPRSAKDAL
jgi:hypothetical protein